MPRNLEGGQSLGSTRCKTVPCSQPEKEEELLQEQLCRAREGIQAENTPETEPGAATPSARPAQHIKGSISPL